ncbi:MAG: hypothetical protein HOE90_24820 [Bacteriovoracaceae bacterium]|jgi:hypothetical protein|nr:hypothetical protein [Bacteriovoracaceae bacterium]
MKSYGLLFILIIIVGCSNHDGGNGKAKLTFHVEGPVKQNLDILSVVTPSQTSDFNCVGVFASSDLLGNRNCYNSSGSVIAQVHKGFGMSAIGNSFGGEMEPEENVTFYLAGMDYNDEGSCPNLNSLGQGDFENNSLVYILGESSPQSIVEGDNDISLSGTFGGQGSEIYYCEGAFQGEASLDCGTKSTYASVDKDYIDCLSSVFSAFYFSDNQLNPSDVLLVTTAGGNYSKVEVNTFTGGTLDFNYATYNSAGSNIASYSSVSVGNTFCFDLDGGTAQGACSGSTDIGVASKIATKYIFPRISNNMKPFFPSVSLTDPVELTLVGTSGYSLHGTSSNTGDCVAVRVAALSKTRSLVSLGSTLSVSLSYDNNIAASGISFHANALTCGIGSPTISSVNILGGLARSSTFYIKTNKGSGPVDHNIIINGSGVLSSTHQITEN